MVWTILGLLFLLTVVIFWVLFTPVIAMFDTISSRYEVRQRGAFSFVLLPGERPTKQFKIMGMEVKPHRYRRSKKIGKKRKRKIKSRSVGRMILLLKRSSKGLTLRYLYLDIDTGDVIMNSELIPLAYFLTRADRHRFIKINFEGKVLVKLKAELRLYIILIAVVKYLLKR